MNAAPLRICVLGGDGLLGRALLRRSAAAGVCCVALARDRADLGRPRQLDIALASVAPDLVINAAAYTNVDRAEADVTAAYAVNRDGAARLARLCAALDLPLIHLSTDFVFGDDLGRPLNEADATRPLGVYGASKLEGEHAVRRAHEGATVVRTSWLYDHVSAGFVATMLRLARERDRLQVVADQKGSPTHVDDLAEGLLALAVRLVRRDVARAGLYHMAGAGSVSRHGWVAAMLREFECATGRRVALEAVPSSAFPTPARRPADSTLDCAQLARDHDLRLPGWQARLEACVSGALAAPAATA